MCVCVCNCLRLCLAHIRYSTWTGCLQEVKTLLPASLGSLIAGLSFLERVALKYSELKASEQSSIDKVSWRFLQTAAHQCINNAGTVKSVRKRGRVANRDPVTLHKLISNSHGAYCTLILPYTGGYL